MSPAERNAELNGLLGGLMSLKLLASKDAQAFIHWFELAGEKLAIEDHLQTPGPHRGQAILMYCSVALANTTLTNHECAQAVERGAEKAKEFIAMTVEKN